MNLLRAIALGVAIGLPGQLAYAASPLTAIEGDVPPKLRVLLLSVIGEVEDPPRSLSQARRRAEIAKEKAHSVMRSQGYYGAEIKARIDEFTSESEEAVRRSPSPVLVITPGLQYTYSDVKIVYHDTAPDIENKVSEALVIKSGKPAIAADVVAAELRAVTYLRAHGYPETASLPRKAVVDHAAKTMRIEYKLRVGDKTRFGAVETTGSAYLAQSWPNMISPFNEGDIFNSRKLNRLSTRVTATGAFDSASAVLSDDKTPNADGTVTRNVILNVEQGDLNTITGEVGFSTTDGTGVDLSYERRNFIGYGQTLTLSTAVKTNQIQLGADYNIPYFYRDDRALDLGAEIAHEDTDAFTGERVSLSGLLTQKFSRKFKISLGAGLEASRFEENDVDVNAYLFEGLGRVEYDSRNSIFDPEKGIHVEADAVPTYNFGDENGVFTAVEAGISNYQRVSQSLVMAGRLKAGTIFGAGQESIPLNRRFYGGGGGSVRGFGFQSISPLDADGDTIGGRSIAEASAELRYHGDSPFGAVAFVDAGSVVSNDLPTLNDIRYGAGVGVRYHTSFAPLRADIAIPLNKRDGDNSFQIYISIGQAF